MQDFTDNFERLGDIQGKFPASTLVLRAQFVYMLQDQFRDLERDYRKISEMYVAEMEKAAKLEQQMHHEKRKRCLAMAEWCRSEIYTECTWHGNKQREEWFTKWERKWLELADKFKR